MTPSVWVAPDGCRHWIIDDGFEGYMTEAFTRAGEPDCGHTPGGGLVGDLDNLEPQLWTDPNGCQHWLMDDGFEGFVTPRRGPDRRPVCS